MEHLDPDAIEKKIRDTWIGPPLSGLEFSLAAQQEADQMRSVLLEGGSSFSFETVGSHPSKVEFMKRARANNYVVALVMVGLDSPEKSRERVAQRFAAGGHNVPENKILERYSRVLDNMRLAVRLASVAIVVDNSIDGDPHTANYRPVALLDDGQVVILSDETPNWVNSVLPDACQRQGATSADADSDFDPIG